MLAEEANADMEKEYSHRVLSTEAFLGALILQALPSTVRRAVWTTVTLEMWIIQRDDLLHSYICHVPNASPSVQSPLIVRMFQHRELFLFNHPPISIVSRRIPSLTPYASPGAGNCRQTGSVFLGHLG